MKSILLSITVVLLISGCGSVSDSVSSIKGKSVIQDIEQYKSAIELAKVGTKDLSAALDNLLYSRDEEMTKQDDVTIYHTRFYANRDRYGVLESFDTYCQHLNGNYVTDDYGYTKARLCLSQSESDKAYFYLATRLYKTNIDKSKVYIKVIEPTSGGVSSTPIELANQEKLDWEQEEERERLEKEEKLKESPQYKREQMRIELSSQTYQDVIKVGTEICKVVGEYRFESDEKGFTEGFANNKIQIRLGTGDIIWDEPIKWFKCEAEDREHSFQM